jgi:hypothetical protein
MVDVVKVHLLEDLVAEWKLVRKKAPLPIVVRC